MGDFLLSLIGQDAKSQLAQDTDRYDPNTRSIERSGLEGFFDTAFGRKDAIQEEAQKRHIQTLSDSDAARTISTLSGAEPEITAGTTRNQLAGEALTAKRKDTREQGAQLRTDAFNDPRAVEERRVANEQRLDLLKQQGIQTQLAQQSAQDSRDQFTALQRERIDEKREGRISASKDRILQKEMGLAELGFKEQQEANRMDLESQRIERDRKASKQERIAAIMGSLANLGAAFAI